MILFPNPNQWDGREPHTLVDALKNREYLMEHPVRYYLTKDKATGKWSVCDRWTDLAFNGYESRVKTAVIRRFFKDIGKPIKGKIR